MKKEVEFLDELIKLDFRLETRSQIAGVGGFERRDGRMYIISPSSDSDAPDRESRVTFYLQSAI